MSLSLENHRPKFEEIIYPNGMINIHSTLGIGRSHGPGKRFLIWTQGCFQRCEGCTNPEMLKDHEKKLTTQGELIEKIRRMRDSVVSVEGITLMGGDPILQARNLVPVLEKMKIKESPGMNILTFSGYTLEHLKELNNSAVNILNGRNSSVSEMIILGVIIHQR